jgi:hypothetical protein
MALRHGVPGRNLNKSVIRRKTRNLDTSGHGQKKTPLYEAGFLTFIL